MTLTQPWSSNDDIRINLIWERRLAMQDARNLERLAAWRKRKTAYAINHSTATGGDARI